MLRDLRLIAYLFVLLTSVSNLGCGPEISEECTDYYAQPSYEREKAFRDYPVEKQLAIYRCAVRREPPELGLAYYIAERGEKNIPMLLDRLKGENDEPTKVGIIYIFELMSSKNYMRGRRDVIDQIKQVVSSMRYKVVREEAEESLKKIIKNSSM